jgi:hypothetical protein
MDHNQCNKSQVSYNVCNFYLFVFWMEKLVYYLCFFLIINKDISVLHVLPTFIFLVTTFLAPI